MALVREHKRKKDIVPQAERIQQVEILEHEAQMLTPELGHFAVLDFGDIPARKTHRAAGGLVQRGKDVQQSGFSAAALAHDGDVFALLYGEIYVPQGLYLYCAEARGIYLL